ncbi:DNA-methyltransferase [Rothia nasimurium]|uniref:DNA-methyltransferase n=1 Tax=Rothia nasimurium TaxID=85336 RepID=UPI001F32F43E|nr:site-specific DNA-methyltransferase [Rothia nasimurium]
MVNNKVKLYNDDCISVIKKMDASSVDLVITDPPYNLGLFMQNRATNLGRMRENFFGDAGWDNADPKEWEELMHNFFKELGRVTKKGANIVVFMAILKVETVVRIASQYKFYYKTTGIWHKTNPMPRNMNLHYINSTEAWIYFTYDSRRGKFNNNGKAKHDFIESSLTPTSEKKFGKHPTQKPLSILKELIEVLSDPYDIVLDPFMGSGSTGVAAIECERKFIGVELEKKYFELASTRILDGFSLS